MGVSTLQAYQSAQLFEAVGLDAALVDAYFTNTPHYLGGADLSRIEADSRYHHDRAFLDPTGGGALPSVGRHRLRSGEGAEEHLYSPEVIHTLQQAAVERRPRALRPLRRHGGGRTARAPSARC